jgi:hypothetical protein
MRKQRLISLLAAALLAPAGTALVTTGTAHAAEGPWVEGIDGVVYEGCNYQPFEYSIPPEMAAYDWSLAVTAYDPRGLEAAGTYLWKDEGDPASGTATGDDNGLQFCSGDTAGTYTIKAELNFYGGPYADYRFDGTPFQMRRAHSRTTLQVNDTTASYGQRLTFRMRSTVEYPRGYFPNQYQYVTLQQKTAGGWKRLGRYFTDDTGRAIARVRWNYRSAVSVRAVTQRTGDYDASTSAAIRIR